MDSFTKFHFGYWWLKSDVDPRFNYFSSGMIGLFYLPKEAKDHISNCETKFNIKRPVDLEYGHYRID